MGNKLRDEDLNLNIIVNGDKGKKELGDLEQSTRKLTERNKELRLEKERLIRAGKQETEEFKKVTAEITTNNKALKTNETRMTELRKQIGLTGLTMRQLGVEQTRLKRLRDSSTFGTDQWKIFDKQLQKVNARITEVRGGASKTHLSLGKMADGFNRYFGLMSAWAASLVGVVVGFKKATQAYAEFTDQVADVQKTTGMTKDEVLELDKSLQEIDTRTSQENLLGLAKVSGKLGIAGKEDAEGFVKAADKIAVALTEDLGGNIEESINDIGKLTDIFNLKDEFGIEQSMLKVGSTINSLGAASTANEGYIVEFTKRMAGVAPAADISITKIMGLGATLDQFGQTSEISSTTISAVLTDMFKSPGEYAKIAGVSISDFNTLLKTDSNEAFIKFLEGLKGNNGGLTEMANKLDGLGLEGKRSISVLGVLSNNTQTLREQQALSSQEFEKGTSLTNEFNIKNTTMAANLDKSRKNLALMTRELGENLSPVMLVSTNGLTYFIKGMTAIIKLFKEHGLEIGIVTAGIAGMVIAQNAQLIVTKAQVIWTKTVTIAQRLWNSAMAANPIGALILGVSLLAAGIVFLVKKLKEQTVAQKAINDVNEQAKRDIIQQKLKMEELLKVAKDQNKNLEERKAALNELKKISPEYFKNLSIEKSSIEDLTKAGEAYIANLEKQALIKAAQAKIEDLRTENANKEIDIQTKKKSWYETEAGAARRRTKAIKENKDAIIELQKIVDKNADKKTTKNKPLSDGDETIDKNITSTSTKDVQSAQDAAQKVVDIAHAKELLKLNQYYADKLELEKEYNARVIAAELALLKAKEKIEPDELKRLELQSQIILKQKEFAAAVKEALPVMTNERKAHKKVNEALIEKEKLQSLSAQKEIEATNAINRMNTVVESQAQLIQDSATALSDSIYELAAGGEDALKNAAMNMIMFALDQLKLQAELSATEVIIQSLAQPDSIATYGAAGIARAGIIIALIEAAFAGAKGLVSSSFNNEGDYWTGGYTENGGKYEYAGNVHKGEFVNNQDAVQNKDVKQFLDVFDYYQRTGQIKKLNTATILASIPGQQMYSGGYSSNTPKATVPVRPIATPKATTPATNTELTAAINQLNTILGKGIKASINKYGTNSLSEGLSDIDKFNKKVGKK